MTVLRYARWARTQVPNGHYLTSTGQRRAAERLIERGFLTKVRSQFTPPVDWLVIKLSKKNWNAMHRAQSASLKSAEGEKP